MLTQEEKIEKKKEAFARDKNYINYGSQYFEKQISDMEERLDRLESSPVKYFSREVTEKQISNEEKRLKSQINIIKEKQRNYEKHRNEVEQKFSVYEEILEDKGEYNDKQIGDENVMKDIHTIRGDKNREQLIKTYRNELMKIRSLIENARDGFSSVVDKNLKYLIDNKGEPIFEPTSNLTKSEFIEMLERDNGKRENHPPLETTNRELLEEQKAILYHNHPEQSRIDTVLDEKNNFNFSSKDKKNISKCISLYEMMAKQEQLIGKINMALKRFEGREADFPKTYKQLQKIKLKADKTLGKLSRKVEKPYNESKVEELHNLVVARKEVDEKRENIIRQEQEVENAKNLKVRLEAEKSKLDEKIKSERDIQKQAEIDTGGVQIQEMRPDISSLIDESKLLQEKLNSVSLHIINSERAMRTEKAVLQELQINASKLGVGLERFTTKAIMPVKTDAVTKNDSSSISNINSGHKNFAESIKVNVNETIALNEVQRKEELAKQTDLSDKDRAENDL